jgi:hypothetical protein
MARNDWYTVKDVGANWLVRKYEPTALKVSSPDDLKLTGTYNVGKQPENAGMCDCFAGTKYCRHKQMVPIFEAANKLGGNWYYSFDKQKWLEAPNTDDILKSMGLE